MALYTQNYSRFSRWKPQRENCGLAVGRAKAVGNNKFANIN
jgi:hypothetical protein